MICCIKESYKNKMLAENYILTKINQNKISSQ